MEFAQKREIYLNFKNNRVEIDHIFNQGSEKARDIAAPILDRTKDKIGLRLLVP